MKENFIYERVVIIASMLCGCIPMEEDGCGVDICKQADP